MKTKLILGLALLLNLALSAGAQAQFTCTTNGGMVTITKYTGPGGAVIVPDAIVGAPVTSIGRGAFAHRGGLVSVVIPDSVTNIDDNAFDSDGATSSLTNVTLGSGVTRIGNFAFGNCSRLAGLNLPNRVASIGDGAFRFCAGLTNISLPATVTRIGPFAFYACIGLVAITVDERNPAYAGADGVLFNKTRTVLIQFPGGKAGNYEIPAGVTNLGDDAVFYCPHLTGVKISEGVTALGVEAFAACGRLETVTLPASLTRIAGHAFDNCVSLKGIYFHGNAPVIGRPSLNGATNAVIYHLPGATGWEATFGGRPTAPWTQ